ncbi:hypothetical protein NDU88_002408 [Pleurodeles waltl]|uniref:Uncharacterized protein n=1 Tax=Pleurodeles waltl TaxID=8319 RepID=A0AAV7T277_PLEWA|nr:hypothetical protein NDU88_002408 [Pleurodeles waltl]
MHLPEMLRGLASARKGVAHTQQAGYSILHIPMHESAVFMESAWVGRGHRDIPQPTACAGPYNAQQTATRQSPEGVHSVSYSMEETLDGDLTIR